MSKIDSTFTNITFQGEDVRQVLKNNPSVVQAIWNVLTPQADCTTTVYVHPRRCDADHLEWYMVSSSPTGRRTRTITQRSLTGKTTFSNL